MSVSASSIMTSGGLIGAVASTSIVILWLVTFHKNLFVSLYKTNKLNAYGVYTSVSEAIRTHIWFLVRAKLPGAKAVDRAALETEVKETFLREFLCRDDVKQLADDEKQVVITNSCRSIFYYVIRTILEENYEKSGEHKIKMALPAVHFGSFHRLLKGMEKSMKCTIEFYEIDLNKHDWALDQDSIDEREIASCDLIMCQHLFGYPFAQDRLCELGNKYSIPVLEDCVQSGSLFGKYKGNPKADVIMFSGGLDKTPQCLGAGLGYFRNSLCGNKLFKKCLAYHESLPMNTWKARFTSCVSQFLHLMIANDVFGINNVFGLAAYVWLTERGEPVKWYAISLAVRKAKSIAPFQHAESEFLRRPNVPHLHSVLYSLTTKRPEYTIISKRERVARDLLLSNIPSKYHSMLFPWFTPEVLQRIEENQGICEFHWVVSPKGDRLDLCEFLNKHHIVVMVNTTWASDEKSTKDVSLDLNNNLIYLPNLTQANETLIRHIAAVLTEYCDKLDS